MERELDLMRPGWTRAGVGRLVAGFYGFYEPWEREAGAVLSRAGLAGVMEGRRKVPALEEDLRYYGGESMDLLSVRRCGRMPDISSAEKALGSMYVLEGSTLGGQIIVRHLREQVSGLEGGGGCSFFASYGADVGVMWRRFQGVLREHSSASTDDAMVAAACETFVLLHDWLHDTAVRQTGDE
jgi:heme oxygenase